MEDQLFSNDTKNALANCPALYAQDGKGFKAIAFVKLVLKEFNYEWYITEYDPNQKIAFGFVNLNDPQNAELGYISINELMNIDGYKIKRDVNYIPKTIKKIQESL